jgi:hypothetical protein
VLGTGVGKPWLLRRDHRRGARGVGYLLHEGGLPIRMRACYLDDDDLVAIASRAEALRAAARRAREAQTL